MCSRMEGVHKGGLIVLKHGGVEIQFSLLYFEGKFVLVLLYKEARTVIQYASVLAATGNEYVV